MTALRTIFILLVLAFVGGCDSPGPTESGDELEQPFEEDPGDEQPIAEDPGDEGGAPGGGTQSLLTATLTAHVGTRDASSDTLRWAAEVRHEVNIASYDAYLTFEPEPGRESHVTLMGLTVREEVSPGVTRFVFRNRPTKTLLPKHGWIGAYRAALFVEDLDGTRVRVEDVTTFSETSPVIPLAEGESWSFDFWEDEYWKYRDGGPGPGGHNTCWAPGQRDQGVLTWTVRERSNDRLRVEEHLLGEHIRRLVGCFVGDEVTPLETTTEFTLTLRDGFWRRTAGTTRVGFALNDPWFKLPAEVSVVPDTVRIGTSVPVTRVVPGEGIVRMDYHYYNSFEITARWRATRR